MPCTVTAQSQYWIGFLHAKRAQANKEILIIYLHLLNPERANDVRERFYDNCPHLMVPRSYGGVSAKVSVKEIKPRTFSKLD